MQKHVAILGSTGSIGTQTLEVIERDTERDFYMDGEAAQKYGIIDKVMMPVDKSVKEKDKA